MILRCILISNFISNQPINWLYTPIELVDFFQPIELASNWLIFAIFILSVAHQIFLKTSFRFSEFRKKIILFCHRENFRTDILNQHINKHPDFGNFEIH
jgi:hypothetical protein